MLRPAQLHPGLVRQPPCPLQTLQGVSFLSILLDKAWAADSSTPTCQALMTQRQGLARLLVEGWIEPYRLCFGVPREYQVHVWPGKTPCLCPCAQGLHGLRGRSFPPRAGPLRRAGMEGPGLHTPQLGAQLTPVQMEPGQVPPAGRMAHASSLPTRSCSTCPSAAPDPAACLMHRLQNNLIFLDGKSKCRSNLGL